VLYNVPSYGLPRDQPAHSAWLAGMMSRYELRTCETYPVNAGPTLESWQVDRYIVYEFVPRTGGPDARIAGGDRAIPSRR
jgi:hypothetical protein